MFSNPHVLTCLPPKHGSRLDEGDEALQGAHHDATLEEQGNMGVDLVLGRSTVYALDAIALTYEVL